MGDNIADLPKEAEIPPLPPKTYQWEDIRRQKLEGRYPWTHLYKAPFDKDHWEESKEHEYEPVIPMNDYKTPPLVKITVEKSNSSNGADPSEEIGQDNNHLRVPDAENEYDNDSDDDDDSDSNASEEITAEELQQRLEEKYFRSSPATGSGHEYELTETRSVSPATTDDLAGSKPQSPKTRSRTDRIRRKLKNFKDQLSKEYTDCSPRLKRKKAKETQPQKPTPPKKNKFNFRKRGPVSRERASSTSSGFRMPQAPQWSFPSLSSFSRSRSGSLKERERKRSQSSETDSKKRFDFHFGTYPRIFHKGKRNDEKCDKGSLSSAKKEPKSAPNSPATRRSPFPQRWISKLKEQKKEEESKPKKETKTSENIVKESIFISLHEEGKQGSSTRSTSEVESTEDASKTESTPSKMEIDNKNFIFISLHEERFPEKLRGQETNERLTEEEVEIERELKKAQTARKFHTMLRKLETDRKLKARRAAQNDDKPEPVVITEVISDDDNNGGRCSETVETSVETPEDEGVRKISGEFVPPERFRVLMKGETLDESTNPDIAPRTSPDSRNQSVPKETIKKVEAEYEKVESKSKESIVDETKPVPQKAPRKKLRKFSSDQESKELSSAFEAAAFENVVVLDEQVITKTYIKESLEEIPARAESIEPEQAARRFQEYEKALESSRKYTSFEIESSFSNNNTLARLEAPVPPERPSRKGTLPRIKQRMSATAVDKENVYESEPNQNYNTFPMAKPDKPRRRFRKRRTYSNSTNNTENAELKNIQELEDDTINKNIVNSKQLSVSFLPLTSDDVGEPIAEYNLRETSSMIHLTVPEPPRPPKRRKDHCGDRNKLGYRTLPHDACSSKTSFSSHEPYTNLELNVGTEIEYADDVNSTIPDSDSPPKPPSRKRSAKPSLPDDDRTSREIDSLPSELSAKDEDFYESDSKDVNGYATIDKPASLGDIKTTERNSDSAPRRKSRRFSDFFTLPRIRVPTNYVSPASQTLDYRRLPRPSRPPRRTRSLRQTTYTNGDITPAPTNTIDFEEEEQLNFNLATEDDVDEPEDPKNLQTDDIVEKMKIRPLPPPPRPTRKPKDEIKSQSSPHYSQCSKKKLETNDLSYRTNIEEKIINTMTMHQKIETQSKNVTANECSNLGTRFDPEKDSYLCEQIQERGCVTREYTIECTNPEEFMRPERSRNLRTGFFEQNFSNKADEERKTSWDSDKRNIITETRIVEREEQVSRVPPSAFEEDIDVRTDSSGTDQKANVKNKILTISKEERSSRLAWTENADNLNTENSDRLRLLNTTFQDGKCNSRVMTSAPEEYLNVMNANIESEKSSRTYQNEKFCGNETEAPFSKTDLTNEESLRRSNAHRNNRISEVNTDQKELSRTFLESKERLSKTNAQRDERTSKINTDETRESLPRSSPENEKNHRKLSLRKEDPISEVPFPAHEKELKVLNTNISKPNRFYQDNSTANAPVVQEEQIFKITPADEKNSNVINATKLNVNEPNVRKLSITEIESSRLITSNVESSSQIPHVQGETENLALNSIEFPARYSTDFITNEEEELVGDIEHKDASPSLDDVHSQNARSRISSMIPEVGSDDESNSTVTKVTRPARRKRLSKSENVSVPPPASSNAGRATLAELIGQILQICHSSVGQAIHSLLEQFIPEDREKRNEVQAAIWIVTIIVAGCLMLGLQTNEKVVHHHHWDFHFPPPH